MKKSTSLFFIGLGIMAHASQEWRTFSSSDGTRTFKGQLTAFDDSSSTVTVLKADRKRFSFKIDVISEADQEYVLENYSKLAPDLNLKIRFEESRDRKGTTRGVDSRTTNHESGYIIYLNSYSPTLVKEAEVEYLMIYRKDAVEEDSNDIVVKGSDIVEIPPNSSASVETETVDLVNYYKAGQPIGSTGGGGCSGGSCGGGGGTIYSKSERSRDLMIGCVARVIVNGKIVSESATSPGILEKYESQLSEYDEKQP